MLVAATVVILLLVSGLQWWQASVATDRLRQETLSQAHLRAAQVTSAASELVTILLVGVDATSRELVQTYLTRKGKEFEAGVRQAVEHLPKDSVLQVAVIDAQGYLAYSNLGMSERTFLGDREHFKVHLEGDSDRFFISRPVLGRVSKQWSIQFSRAIRSEGKLVGVMVMSVSPTYLHDAMARVTLDSDDTLAVLRQSGEYLARNRDQEASLGKLFDAGHGFTRPDAPVSGRFNARSPVDRVERIFSWQRLEHYPITVLLGLSEAAVLGPIERVVEETRFNALVSTALLWLTAAVVIGLVRRVRVQVRRREEVEFLAMHDMLTGLHSRHALMEHLHQVIADAAERGGRVGVLYMDLNGFKPVNDRYGHAFGDEVLQAVAGRLRGCVRGSDFPARIGGDEFVVVVDQLTDDHALEHLAERIVQALAPPMSVHGATLQIGASIGLSIYPDHGQDADALLVHADHEMYAHKADPGRSPAAAQAGSH